MIARAGRRTLMFLAALLVVAALWETYKAFGPDDGGSILGARVVPKSNDRAMPHIWDMVVRLADPESTAAGSRPLWIAVTGYAWYTLRLAIGGLVLGSVIGIGLAALMARFDVARRGLLPWVIMSQTVPLIALAPQVVSWSGRFDIGGWEWPRWASVCVLAAFLAFFPVTVGTLRGLASPPAAALELMESCAATWWQTLRRLRFPAAISYIVPSLKLGATASVIGVIVSEISTGIPGGIGRAVISYAQAATSDPEKLYGALFGAAALGLALYGSIVALEMALMRGRPQEGRS
ncbi:MAG: ABC transporter permease [Ilumatobacteraceae bacterium]